MDLEWELSESLTSDGEGVRAVCVLPSLDDDKKKDSNDATVRILTGTQAGSLVLYNLSSQKDEASNNGSRFLSCESLHRHPHAVTTVLSVDALNIYATACKDAVIRIFDNKTHELVKELTGHDKPVTSLAFAQAGSLYLLVSGSWDGTARVWNLSNYSLLATLPDHENSVCVAALQGSDKEVCVVTGSAGLAQNNSIVGHAIRVWSVDVHSGQVNMQHHVAGDHDGPIRGLCTFKVNEGTTLVASCSNDGTVKLRDSSTGHANSTLSFLMPDQAQQQPPMLLSVAPVAEDSLAAAAEDGAVVIWNMHQQESEPQLLVHGSTVWSVYGLLDGDLVTACQDGHVRIFTRSTDRMAPLEVRQAFADEVRAKKQGSGPSAEEIAKLPQWQTNLRLRGSSEGQVQLFQRDGIAIAAQWSAASQTWIEVGQVMGNPGGGGGDNVIDGITYDHVFPIEVDSPSHPGGVASLRLGYNNGENPFVAAQRFIDAHVLPQYHLSQIADYITQRSGHAGVTLGGPAGGFSGGSMPSAVTGVPFAAYNYLPMKTYKVFDLSEKQAATTMEKMKAKIEVVGNLSNDQLASLSSLMNTLQATSRYHASEISDAELQVILVILNTFPPAEAFPALDLGRMAVLHPDAASRGRSAYWSQIIQRAIQLCETSATENIEGPAAVGIPMLSLRLFANAFKGGAGSLEAAATNLESIVDCGKSYATSPNKNVRLSIATLIGNICLYLHSVAQGGSIFFPLQLLSIIDEILSNYKLYEAEAILRTLIGLGTLVMGVPEAKNAAQSLFLAPKVQPAASQHGDDAKNAAREVYSVLQ
ncbi:hypothetical protein MPSEU_000803400 [Mayamaea pseudoterrestris]|nr:hypothetical protein MPSEU_000803400 [Mayamaea pseudoterrestris]